MARWCALRGARVRVADSRATPPGLDALREDAPLNAPDPQTFYAAGPAGYTDYPALA